MRHHTYSAYIAGYSCKADAGDCGIPHVHVFTDADLSQHGHERLGYGNAGRYLRTGYRTPCTHVAIPLEQYVRIFGEL